MTVLLPYCKAFAVGGLLCLIGQLLIDYTKLTPGRILTIYVVSGVALGALGTIVATLPRTTVLLNVIKQRKDACVLVADILTGLYRSVFHNDDLEIP